MGRKARELGHDKHEPLHRQHILERDSRKIKGSAGLLNPFIDHPIYIHRQELSRQVLTGRLEALRYGVGASLRVSGGNVLANVIVAGRVFDYDILEDDVLHRIRCASHDDSGLHCRVDDGDVTQSDVDVAGVGWHVALCKRYVGPAEAAGRSVTDVHIIRLLCWSDPDGPLLGLVHHDVLVDHVLDQSWASELGVDPLVRVMHEAITERDVAHGRVTYRSDRKSETACMNPLDEHVLGSILDANAVILIPNRTIMDPHVSAGHVEPIGIEGAAPEMRVS